MREKQDNLVLFFIGCFNAARNTGAGGHYYSLKDMARSIGVPYEVVVVGDFFPSALSGIENVVFIQCVYGTLWSFPYKKFLNKKVKVIHAFDKPSSVFAAVLSRLLKVPLVVTKPGGPPSPRYFVPFSNMIVFHKGDLVDIQSRRMRPRRVKLIPHRVVPPDLKNKPERNPFEYFPPAKINIISIGRIGQVYEKKIRQAIALRGALSRHLGSANLCIVGEIQDQTVFIKLQKDYEQCNSIKFFTTERYTYMASRYLTYSDAAVATGRGLMESLSYGKYSFFPVNDSDIPCLLLPKNYEKAFLDNFSFRIKKGIDIDPHDSLEILISRHDTGMKSWYEQWAKSMFEKDHSAATGARKTLGFYASLDDYESMFRVALVPLMDWTLRVVLRFRARLTHATRRANWDST